MVELPEELGIEVEALSHLFGDDAFSISSEGTSTTLAMPLLPRQLDGEHEAYVAANLKLQIDNSSYPTTAIAATLEDSKGLTDAACNQLQAALQAEAENLVGEMVLGHLCELALDLLTEANHPNGNCIFCLEDVVSQIDSTYRTTNASYQVLKLPCFHCFHIPCFTAWFQWQQAAAAAAATEITAPGQPLPPAGQDVECENGWLAKNIYTIKCPSCRLEVPPYALRHALPQLLENGTTTNTPDRPAQKTTIWTAAHPKAKDVLSPQALQQLLEMQKRFKQVLDLQRACGGLVQENVAVSVAELEAAAAEKRQQQQQQQKQDLNQDTTAAKESASNPSKSAPHKGGGGGGRSGGERGRGAPGRGRGSGGNSGGSGRGKRGRGGGPPRPSTNPPPPPPSQ